VVVSGCHILQTAPVGSERQQLLIRCLWRVQESFFGKLLLHLVVFGILLIRSTDDIEKYKNLFDEATFYDKQWNATWEGQVRPSEQEKSQ